MAAVGEVFSKQHVFSRAEIADFALRSGDPNPLHHDPEIARRSRFGGIIASGPHSTAVLMALTAARFSEPHGMVGLQFSFKFEKPIAEETPATLSWTVRSVEPKDRLGADVVGLDGSIKDEAGALLVSATGRVLVWRTSQPATASGGKR